MDEIKFIFERLDKFENKLDAILRQTTLTNGRVSNLEKNQGDHDDTIEDHSKYINQNQGRDKVLYIVIGALGALVGIIISYFLSK